jgi:hypothetical protein
VAGFAAVEPDEALEDALAFVLGYAPSVIGEEPHASSIV